MKKLLMVLLATCACTNASPTEKSLDLTIVNKTDNIDGRPGCKFEFMPSLSSFIEMPKITANDITPGGEEKIHLDFSSASSILQSARINYIVRCEGFDARLDVIVAGNKYYANMSMGNKLSLMESTGSSVTDKSVVSSLTSKDSIHKLIIKQKQ